MSSRGNGVLFLAAASALLAIASCAPSNGAPVPGPDAGPLEDGSPLDSRSGQDATPDAPLDSTTGGDGGSTGDATVADASPDATPMSEGSTADGAGPMADAACGPFVPVFPPTMACPDAGASPGGPTADSCSGAVPNIVSSGSYTFTMTGQQHNFVLPCAPTNYPTPRDVVFSLCVANAGTLELSVSGPSGDAYTVALGSTCGGSDQSCVFPVAASDGGAPLSVKVAPGNYYVAVEGYLDGAGTLNVTLPPVQPPSTPAGPPFAGCCAAQQYYGFYADGGLDDSGMLPVVDRPFNTLESLLQLSGPSQVLVAGYEVDVTVSPVCGDGGLQEPPGEGMATTVLGPGLYDVLVKYGILVGMHRNTYVVEVVTPPPPRPTKNATCATAQALPVNATYTETQVFEPTDFYYSVTTSNPGLAINTVDVMPPAWYANPNSAGLDYGGVTFTVYGTCDDAATELGTFCNSGGSCAGSATFAGLPPGTYWLHAAVTEPGTQYEVTVTN
jgi:hypothetical protein